MHLILETLRWFLGPNLKRLKNLRRRSGDFLTVVGALHEAPVRLALECIIIPKNISEFVYRMTLLTAIFFRGIMDILKIFPKEL